MSAQDYSARDYNGFIGFDAGEAKVAVPGGYLVFPSYEKEPSGCSYVRFTDQQGIEQAYWVSDEWAEDPMLVMGAIMACVQSGPGHDKTPETLADAYGSDWLAPPAAPAEKEQA